MLENQILDTIDKISVNSLTDAERSILVAVIKSDMSNKKYASTNSLITLALSKINDIKRGDYREAQVDSSSSKEQTNSKTPFAIINQDEIDKFLCKMSPERDSDMLPNDSWDWDFEWIGRALKSEGEPRHRSDFNTSSI